MSDWWHGHAAAVPVCSSHLLSRLFTQLQRAQSSWLAAPDWSGTQRSTLVLQVRMEFDFQREADVMDSVAHHLRVRISLCTLACSSCQPLLALLARYSCKSPCRLQSHHTAATLLEASQEENSCTGLWLRCRVCGGRLRSRAAYLGWSRSAC